MLSLNKLSIARRYDLQRPIPYFTCENQQESEKSVRSFCLIMQVSICETILFYRGLVNMTMAKLTKALSPRAVEKTGDHELCRNRCRSPNSEAAMTPILVWDPPRAIPFLDDLNRDLGSLYRIQLRQRVGFEYPRHVP